MATETKYTFNERIVELQRAKAKLYPVAADQFVDFYRTRHQNGVACNFELECGSHVLQEALRPSFNNPALPNCMYSEKHVMKLTVGTIVRVTVSNSGGLYDEMWTYCGVIPQNVVPPAQPSPVGK